MIGRKVKEGRKTRTDRMQIWTHKLSITYPTSTTWSWAGQPRRWTPINNLFKFHNYTEWSSPVDALSGAITCMILKDILELSRFPRCTLLTLDNARWVPMCETRFSSMLGYSSHLYWSVTAVYSGATSCDPRYFVSIPTHMTVLIVSLSNLIYVSTIYICKNILFCVYVHKHKD